MRWKGEIGVGRVWEIEVGRVKEVEVKRLGDSGQNGEGC